MKELFATYARGRGNYDKIALSATWMQFSRLVRSRRAVAPSAQLSDLIQDTERMAKQEKLGSRELSNVSYAVARSLRKMDPQTTDLLDVLAESSTAIIGQFNPQDLANTAW
eukprot:6213457-Pleurochrysis_carterae.AAC.1